MSTIDDAKLSREEIDCELEYCLYKAKSAD